MASMDNIARNLGRENSQRKTKKILATIAKGVVKLNNEIKRICNGETYAAAIQRHSQTIASMLSSSRISDNILTIMLGLFLVTISF